ncbi:MAG: hypothetical protein AAB407_04210 [Patescibacteria group bacterium]
MSHTSSQGICTASKWSASAQKLIEYIQTIISAKRISPQDIPHGACESITRFLSFALIGLERDRYGMSTVIVRDPFYAMSGISNQQIALNAFMRAFPDMKRVDDFESFLRNALAFLKRLEEEVSRELTESEQKRADQVAAFLVCIIQDGLEEDHRRMCMRMDEDDD